MLPAWTVAAVIVLSAAVFAALFLTRKRQSVKIRVNDNRKPEIKTKAPKKPAQDLSAGHTEKRQSDLWAYFQSYKNMLARINIPPGALTVRKCACVFCLEYVVLNHYIWCRDGVLCFFPKWRDIALFLADPACLFAANGSERELIFGWAIPVDYIKYYIFDDTSGTTTVYYEDKKGKKYKTVFLEGGVRALKKLLPEKDYDIVKRREYLGSYNNILEMEGRISQLKIKKEQGLISGQEYEVQKEYIMRNL